jgi:hypothetical protein
MEQDLSELAARAAALRNRFSAFLAEFGEFGPPLRRLGAALDEIDEHLAALDQRGGSELSPDH